MVKFIKAEDIPEEMNALAFWVSSRGETMWQMSKSAQGAKQIMTRHNNAAQYGWQIISTNDRQHGIMVW